MASAYVLKFSAFAFFVVDYHRERVYSIITQIRFLAHLSLFNLILYGTKQLEWHKSLRISYVNAEKPVSNMPMNKEQHTGTNSSGENHEQKTPGVKIPTMPTSLVNGNFCHNKGSFED